MNIPGFNHRAALLPLLGLALALPAAAVDNDRYYHQRGGLKSYPAYAVDVTGAALPADAADQRQVYRMARYIYDDVTPEEARAIARNFKRQGINLVISEKNRYLLHEYGATPGGNQTLRSEKSLDSIIANTNRMVEACHAEGILFIHHITATMVDSAIFQAHPKWQAIQLDTGKTIENHYGTGNSCINNADYMKAFYQALEKLLSQCKDADGIMVDEIQFFGDNLCACKDCRKLFRADTGLKLPTPEEYRDEFGKGQASPIYYRWLDWRAEKIAAHHQKIRELIKKNNPNANYFLYLCNNSSNWSFLHTGLEISKFLPYGDALGLECEPPRFDYQAYWPLVIYELKYLRAIAERNDDTPWVLYYSVKPFDQSFGWLLSFAEGCKTWFTWNADSEVQPLATWEAVHQNVLGKLRSAADIALLFSSDSRDHNPVYSVEWKKTNIGVANALSAGQTPYKLVSPLDFTTGAELRRHVDTLLLFDETVITPKQADVLRDFVRRGGTLVTGGMVGTADLNWKQRGNFILSDLFGFDLDSDGWPTEYLEVNLDDFRADGNSTRLAYSGQFVNVKNIAADVKSYGRFTNKGNTLPAILTRKVGDGEVIYFAGHFGDQYFYDTHSGENPLKPDAAWTDLRKPHYRQFINLLANANNPQPAVRTANLPEGILLEVFDHDFAGLKGKAVTLLNLRGMQFHDGVQKPWQYNFPEVAPDRPMTIAVPQPEVKKVYLLSPDYDAAVELPLRYENGYAVTEITRLDRAAMIYFCAEGQDYFTRLPGGVTAAIPAAKELLTDYHPALAAPEDRRAFTLFADSPAMNGGIKVAAGIKEEPAQVIYGAGSDCAAITAKFTTDRELTDPMLELGGMDDNLPATRAAYRITFDGSEVFNGASTFPDDAWMVERYPLPQKKLAPGEHELKITMTAPGVRGGKPWLAVAFARLKENH